MAKILGITDERNTCECCGKQRLKRTVAIDFDGDVRYYGTTCAAKALKFPDPERFTSRNAEALLTAFERREKSRQEYATAVESAKAQAIKYGQPVSLVRKNGRYSTMLRSHFLANNNPSWGYEVEVYG